MNTDITILTPDQNRTQQNHVPKDSTSSTNYLGRKILAGVCIAGAGSAAAYYFYPEKVIASFTCVRNAWNTSHTVQVIGQHIHYAIAKLGEINLAAISTPHLLIAAAAVVVIAAAIIYIRRRNASNTNNDNNNNNQQFPQTPCTISRNRHIQPGTNQRYVQSPLRNSNNNTIQLPQTPVMEEVPYTLEQWIEDQRNLEDLCSREFEKLKQNGTQGNTLASDLTGIEKLSLAWQIAVEQQKENLILSKLSNALKVEFYYYVVYQHDKKALYYDIAPLNPEVIPGMAKMNPGDIREYVTSYDNFIQNNLKPENFGYNNEDQYLREVSKDKQYLNKKLKEEKDLFECSQKAFSEALFESLKAQPENVKILLEICKDTEEEKNRLVSLNTDLAWSITTANHEIISIFENLKKFYKLTDVRKIKEIMTSHSLYNSYCDLDSGYKDTVDFFSECLDKKLININQCDQVQVREVESFLLSINRELNDSEVTFGECFLNALAEKYKSDLQINESCRTHITNIRNQSNKILQLKNQINENENSLNRKIISLWNFEDLITYARDLSEEIEFNGITKKKGEAFNSIINQWLRNNENCANGFVTRWKNNFFRNKIYGSLFIKQ